MLCQLLSSYKNKEKNGVNVIQTARTDVKGSLEEVNHTQLQYITMLFTSVPLP